MKLNRARRCDLWGRQCDQLLLSGDYIFTPGRQPGPQDRWLSSLRKRTLMIIYPLQKQRIANGFANALTFCPNALKVCLNVLTICLNALTISSNTLTDCSYDLTVGPSNVWLLLERGLWKSQVINSTGGPNVKFSENICSEDDLRSGVFGTFVVKFIACLPLLGFSNI